jgi:hypothetical protein
LQVSRVGKAKHGILKRAPICEQRQKASHTERERPGTLPEQQQEMLSLGERNQNPGLGARSKHP